MQLTVCIIWWVHFCRVHFTGWKKNIFFFISMSIVLLLTCISKSYKNDVSVYKPKILLHFFFFFSPLLVLQCNDFLAMIAKKTTQTQKTYVRHLDVHYFSVLGIPIITCCICHYNNKNYYSNNKGTISEICFVHVKYS